MSLESDISRIRELLEVVTEVVVEKLATDDGYERCGSECMCADGASAEDDSSDNEATIEFVSEPDGGSEILMLRKWLLSQIKFVWQDDNTTSAYNNTLDEVNKIISKAGSRD